MAIEKVTPNFLKHAPFPHSFTTILNDTIDLIPDDATLGIYVYLARKPEDWQIQEKDIMSRFSRGRDHVRKCLGLLKNLGLLCKNAVRDEKGHIKHWETILYRHIPENPSSGQSSQAAPTKEFSQITENPSSGSVHIPENPTCGEIQKVGFPTHTNKRYIQNKESLQKKELSSPVFIISQFADEWILRIKHESGDKREDDDLLMQVKYRIDNRDQTKHTETQTLKSTVKWISQGCFDVPAGYINPKDAERKKNQEAVKKREFDEAQARQHEEKMRSYKSSSESKPSQERRASPTRLADLLKGKIPDAN